MNHFNYKNNHLYCEDVKVADIASKVGTPFYLYSHATVKQHFKVFDNAFSGIKHLTCFSVKANSSLAILRLFLNEGSGLDIVSGGELFRALRAGAQGNKIVYSGVGKQIEDLEYAIKSGILMFNAESSQEIHTIDEVAGRLGKKARIAIRVNPDVDPQTHPYISTGLKENKFGIEINEAFNQYLVANKLPNLKVEGISCHIGSQLTNIRPFEDALVKVIKLIEYLKHAGITIKYLDIGGGLGITYKDEKPPHPDKYALAIKKTLNNPDLTLITEPGRVIMGNAGVMITKVIYSKTAGDKLFYIMDAAMNDLMRPSLYDAFHAIQPVEIFHRKKVIADIVGPICESGDFFAKERQMEAYQPQELMAIMSAGAYGFTMSSNYNSRTRPCEVMVKNNCFYIIRNRETYEDLIRGEILPDFLEKS